MWTTCGLRITCGKTDMRATSLHFRTESLKDTSNKLRCFSFWHEYKPLCDARSLKKQYRGCYTLRKDNRTLSDHLMRISSGNRLYFINYLLIIYHTGQSGVTSLFIDFSSNWKCSNSTLDSNETKLETRLSIIANDENCTRKTIVLFNTSTTQMKISVWRVRLIHTYNQRCETFLSPVLLGSVAIIRVINLRLEMTGHHVDCNNLHVTQQLNPINEYNMCPR